MRVANTIGLVALGAIVGLTTVASAWTAAPSSPPSNNAAPPLNTSSAGQTKNGFLQINNTANNNNSLSVVGNLILSGTGNYLNFGSTWGTAGYGIWDNSGVLNFKNSGGSWQSIQAIVTNLMGSTGLTAPYLPVYAAWASLGTGTGGAAIYNDNGSYKTLMIVGNNSAGGNREVGLWDDLTVSNNLYVNGDIKVGGGTYFGNYGMINFPSSDNDNGFFWVCTSYNGCATNTWDLRLYLQDDQDDTEKFSVWGGSCSNGGCAQNGSNVIEQFHVTAAGNGWFRGNVNAASFLYNSDRRLKTDIQPLEGNLEKILALQPVTYLWKDPSVSPGTQVGFIAQDVQKVIPEIVHTDASTTMESIDYIRLTPYLTGSIQELDQKIMDQQTQIGQQQQRLDSQQNEIDELKSTVAALQAAK